MNIGKISIALREIFIIITGMIFIWSQLRVFSDYFIARNPLFSGKVVNAKIVDFYLCYYGIRKNYYSVVEYKNNENSVTSVVQRDLRDRLNSNIAIRVADDNFTVRYNLYLPYNFLGDISIAFVCFAMMLKIWWEWVDYGIEIKKLIPIVVIGIIFGYLYYPKVIYHAEYSKKCSRIRFLENNPNEFDPVRIEPMQESLTISNVKSRSEKIVSVFFWGILIIIALNILI